MSIFLRDPNEVRLPPEEVRLLKVQVTPRPNGRQVKVRLELTPFIKRPNIEVSIISDAGKEVGHTSILETMLPILEFTMHLRQAEPGSQLTMNTTVYYQKLPVPSDTSMGVSLPDPLIVDHHTLTFRLPHAEIPMGN